MTPERFRDLADIYGADPRRWPAAEREAALAFMRDNPYEAEAAFARAAALDEMLSVYSVAPVPAALRERIIASAPGSRRRIWRRAGLWWQAAGLAGLGLAGALAGAIVFSAVMPFETQVDDDSGYVITAFDEFSPRSEP